MAREGLHQSHQVPGDTYWAGGAGPGRGRAGQGRSGHTSIIRGGSVILGAHLHKKITLAQAKHHHKQCQMDQAKQEVGIMREQNRQICQTNLNQRANLAGGSCEGKPVQQVDIGDTRVSGLDSIT